MARFAARRQEEVTGFLQGLDAGHADPERFIASARKALDALATANHVWSEYDRLIREQPAEGAESPSETLTSLRELDQVVGSAMRVILAEQRRARLGQMSPRSAGGTYVKPPEPGRNAPCLTPDKPVVRQEDFSLQKGSPHPCRRKRRWIQPYRTRSVCAPWGISRFFGFLIC